MRAIGFFNSVLSWGGGEKWHYEAAIYFSEKGFPVCFYVSPNSELHKRLKVFKKITIKTIDVNGLSFLNPFKVNALKKSFQNSNLQTLIINLPNDVKLAAHAAKLANVEKIIYRRGSAIPIKNSWLNRFTFRNWVTHILANSKATKKTILQHNQLLFPEKKIDIIYNPIDSEEFISRPYRVIYEAQPSEIIIGCLGRLEYEKNQQFLIGLSEKLKAKGIAHKILIGGTGSLENALKEEAIKRKVDGNMLFLGFLNNVKDLLMTCDVFVLPSLWEGFGYVLAEASLCKKPIIAFNVSSIPEVVIENESGFLISNNLEECLKKIMILQENKELREKMGEFGLKHITSTFNRKKIMNKLEEYLMN